MHTSDSLSLRGVLSILSAGLFAFAGVLVETATNITFPTLMKQFSINTSLVQWMTTGNLLVICIMVPISSFLKKRFSTRGLFFSAALIFLAGILLDLFAPVFPLLLAGRVIQGAGVGIALPLMYNIILEETPQRLLGTMMGVGSFVIGAAPACGPTFGGLMIQHFSWRAIFGFMLPIILVALVLGFFAIRKDTGDVHESMDFPGFIMIALSFTALIFGFSNLDALKTSPLGVIACLLFAFVLMMLFIKHENNTSHPLVSMHIFKNRSYTCHAFAVFSIQIMTLGLGFLLPSYIQIVLHGNATSSGLVLLPGAILTTIESPIGGMILDHFGAKKPLMIGALCCLGAMIGFVVFSRHLTYSLCLIFYTLYSLGMGISMGNTITSALASLPLQDQVDGNAGVQTLQQLSGAVGTSVSAAILAFSQVSTALSSTTRSGVLYVFIFLMIVAMTLLILQINAFHFHKED